MTQHFVPADRFPLATVGDVLHYLGAQWAVVGVLEGVLILAPVDEHVAHRPTPAKEPA